MLKRAHKEALASDKKDQQRSDRNKEYLLMLQESRNQIARGDVVIKTLEELKAMLTPNI